MLVENREECVGHNVTAIVIAFLAAVVISVCCGCCNIIRRTECEDVWCGVRSGSPYVCADHPYYCTKSVATECLAAPYYGLIDNDNLDWGQATWYMFATVTYPFWVVDEACEIVLDTVMLPVDAVWYWGIREVQ